MGASWHSRLLKEGGKGKRAQSDKARGRGDFDILAPKAAPAVVFEKGAKGKGGTTGGGIGGIGAGKGAEGEGEEVVEKTMLQKCGFPFFLSIFAEGMIWVWELGC